VILQADAKIGTIFNFIKCEPIFKIILLSESVKIWNTTIVKDPIAPQVCRYTTLCLAKSTTTWWAFG